MSRRDIVRFSFAIVMGVASASAVSTEDLQIENAWIRAMPPTQRMTAGYLDIHNPGTIPVEILGARAGIAKLAEIHTSQEIDGYVRMQHLERFTINPGATISLSPGGMHLMLMGLEKMPAVGTDAEICLISSSGSEICAQATVRRGSAGVQSQHH
ncbi:MAG: copper chaperone PCu(A)C [Halioglobus sp.]